MCVFLTVAGQQSKHCCLDDKHRYFDEERPIMHSLKRLSLTALALIAAALLFTAPSYATPIPLKTANLNAPGDKLLTVDTHTGLEFLDPAVTSGLTYNEIGASSFVTKLGFRFATTSELQEFLSDGGITNSSGNFNTTDEAAVENLLSNFIGQTITGPITLPPAGGGMISDGIYGFTNDPGVPSGQFNVAGLDYQSAALGEAPQDQARTILNLISFHGDKLPPNPGGNGINGSIVGGFLVRSVPVPEPSSIGVMGLGSLLLLAGVGLRRRYG